MNADHDALEVARRLAISSKAIEEAIRRHLLTFVSHRNCRSWRFGDQRNGCFRRLDGEPFRINGESVKAEAETRGIAWHRLIGLDDVAANDRHDILLIPEGSKDALAALHFAEAEGTLPRIGVVAALGAGINLLPKDAEVLRGRRIRIFGDVDQAGLEAIGRIGTRLASVATEVQTFNLAWLRRDDGSPVKDLFDLSRIDYDDFESNRDLWSITDLDSKGERVRVITDKEKLSFSLPSPPHLFPGSHGFPVYPVSNSEGPGNEVEKLALRNACTKRDTARKRRWQLARDLVALEKKISRKLTPDELMQTFDKWYAASAPHLDPEKASDTYCGKFLAEIGKVRVPTGEGESLKTALKNISASPFPEIPGRRDAPESWRCLAALHRELARRSASGNYFLSCRDAAKAHATLNKDSANQINHALAQLGVIDFLRIGAAHPGGRASEFRYLLAR